MTEFSKSPDLYLHCSSKFYRTSAFRNVRIYSETILMLPFHLKVSLKFPQLVSLQSCYVI